MADEGRHFLRLEVVSPDGLVFEGDVALVVVPAARGELGVLPRHAPLVARLNLGSIQVKTLDGRWILMSTSGGFVKVQFDKVIILVDAAELAEEIDVARAEAAVAQATERLRIAREGGPGAEDVDVYAETLALRRARNRLKVVAKV